MFHCPLFHLLLSATCALSVSMGKNRPVFSGEFSLMVFFAVIFLKAFEYLRVQDMWEPSISIDPTSNDMFIFSTNNNGIRGCVTCGIDPILYRRSSDNGATWSQINNFTWEYLDRGEDIGETADPVAVVASNGDLLVTYMSDWNITFKKSTDKGKTWTDRVYVSGTLESDKNWHSVSPTEPNKIFVTFNALGVPYEVHTIDGGETWSDPQMLDYIPETYFFACGSVVRTDGTVFIAYAAPADGDLSGPSYVKVYSSDDDFGTMNEYLIDYWTGGQSCPEWADCSTDFLNGGCALAIDSEDNVYYSYNGYANNGVDALGQQIFISYIRVGDQNFSQPMVVSDNPVSSDVFVAFPMIAGGLSEGDVRVAWMDNRTGMWNVFYREISDFSALSESIRISTYSKFTFENSDGFVFPYGDYGTMVVDSSGYTHIVWGEGLGHYAGGTVMYATQAPEIIVLSSSDDDDEVLSYDAAIAISCIFSFLGGAVFTLAGFVFAQKLMVKDEMQTPFSQAM
jgi:hypothetical protein